MQPLPPLQHCYDRDNAEGELKSQVERVGKPAIKDELLQQTKDDATKKRAECRQGMGCGSPSTDLIPGCDRKGLWFLRTRR
jgi:hypothetical protein